MKQIRYLGLFFLIAAVIGCKPKQDPTEFDLGYSYFWMDEHFFIIYDVDSIEHIGSTDVVHEFQVKEKQIEWYTDGENEAAMRIELWKRENSSAEWQPYKVSTQKRTTTTVQRVDENVRFIKLTFPVEEGKTWNGHAYTSLGEQDFRMNDVHQPYLLNGISLDSTLRVTQYSTSTFLTEKTGVEYYAKDVGLVYKKLVDISTQSGERRGSTVEMAMSEYGYE
jgi:hypothetical protein